jgi:hypothetical protein
MKKSIYILLLFFLTFNVNGQDTIYYWGYKPTNKAKCNRYEIQKQTDKFFIQQCFSYKGGTWIKSDYSDSIVFESDNSILNFDLYHNSVYDSTHIKIDSLPTGFKIEEIYDNGEIKLTGFSLTKYPFNFHGKLTMFYRNGQKYADYFYTNNEIDSIKYSQVDSLIMIEYIANRNDSLITKVSEITKQITQKMNFVLPTESGIISAFYFAICLENNKITRTLIYRKTEFIIDNELLKAIEKIELCDILEHNISGCITIPLRINLQ